MDPLTIGLGVSSLAGNIFGNIMSGKANNANRKLIEQQRQKNESFYNNNVNRDFLETNAAKGLFERLRKNLYDNNKIINSTAAVTGASDEAVIAEKSRNQENYNDAVNQLASQATQYQQNEEQMYRNADQNLANQEMQLNANQAQNAANAVQNAAGVASAAANMAGALPGTNIAGVNQFGRTPAQEATLRQMGNSAFSDLNKRLNNQFIIK